MSTTAPPTAQGLSPDLDDALALMAEAHLVGARVTYLTVCAHSEGPPTIKAVVDDPSERAALAFELGLTDRYVYDADRMESFRRRGGPVSVYGALPTGGAA